jgi:hypothetical protein
VLASVEALEKRRLGGNAAAWRHHTRHGTHCAKAQYPNAIAAWLGLAWLGLAWLNNTIFVSLILVWFF